MPYANIKITDTAYGKNLEVNTPSDNIDLDINGQTLNLTNITIDASDTFRFYSDDLSDYDMANGKIAVSGDLTLTGSSSQQLQINNLDFESTSGIATYCTVTNSQNAGTDIDATDVTNTDAGGNTGWNFDAVVAGLRSALGMFYSLIYNSLLCRR